ncbi:MAG: hypothetical protein M1359_09430 [Betaproteobacteria bacterium]|nr:hypothetical protein [Betaproteobacteria bacterium]
MSAATNAVPLEEQLVWLRHFAQVQQRVSQTVRQMADRIEALEADLLRHRAQAILERTAKWWAVPMPMSMSMPRRSSPLQTPRSGALPSGSQRSANRTDWALKSLPHTPSQLGAGTPAPWPESDAVLCQTACVGHAHHWLQDDGQCQRKGGECERVQAQGGVYVPSA